MANVITAVTFPGDRVYRVNENGVTSIEEYKVNGEMAEIIRYRVRFACGLEVTGPQRLATTEEQRPLRPVEDRETWMRGITEAIKTLEANHRPFAAAFLRKMFPDASA